MTRRAEGDLFEAVVKERFEKYMPGLKQTIASGAIFGDQDLVSDDFRISVKQRSLKGLTREELQQPYSKEPYGTYRIPVTVLRMIEYEPEITFHEVICVSALLIKFFGRQIVINASDYVDSFKWILVEEKDWPHGLTVNLCRMLPFGELRLMKDFPMANEYSCLMRLSSFIELLAAMRELIVLSR